MSNICIMPTNFDELIHFCITERGSFLCWLYHQVNGLIDRCSNCPCYRFFVMCCLGDLVSEVSDRVKASVMNGLLQLQRIDLEKESDRLSFEVQSYESACL